MHTNIEVLSAIRNDLYKYSSTNNRNGFIAPFYNWVHTQWSIRAFYSTEIANFALDFTHYPHKTDFLLKEKAKTYRDFIHANNGRHNASFLSEKGTTCETLEKDLYDFFHESMRLRGIKFLEQNYPELDAEKFWDQIFCDEFYEPKEISLVEDIQQNFGFYGLALEPYLCPLDDETSSEQQFAKWRLADFAYRIGKAKPPLKVIINPNPGPSKQLKVLSSKPFKKNLSQSGLFA